MTWVVVGFVAVLFFLMVVGSFVLIRRNRQKLDEEKLERLITHDRPDTDDAEAIPLEDMAPGLESPGRLDPPPPLPAAPPGSTNPLDTPHHVMEVITDYTDV